jgi:hypothetical protein
MRTQRRARKTAKVYRESARFEERMDVARLALRAQRQAAAASRPKPPTPPKPGRVQPVVTGHEADAAEVRKTLRKAVGDDTPAPSFADFSDLPAGGADRVHTSFAGLSFEDDADERPSRAGDFARFAGGTDGCAR